MSGYHFSDVYLSGMFFDSFLYITQNEAWKSIMRLKWCVIQYHRFLIPPHKLLWMALAIILSRSYSSALDSLVISFNKGINYSLQGFSTRPIGFGITASAVIFLQRGLISLWKRLPGWMIDHEAHILELWLLLLLRWGTSVLQTQMGTFDTLGDTYKCKWVSGDHNMSNTHQQLQYVADTHQ